MADGGHCPNCGNDIGVWPIFAAVAPSRIWRLNPRQRID